MYAEWQKLTIYVSTLMIIKTKRFGIAMLYKQLHRIIKAIETSISQQ